MATSLVLISNSTFTAPLHRETYFRSTDHSALWSKNPVLSPVSRIPQISAPKDDVLTKVVLIQFKNLFRRVDDRNFFP